MLQTIRQWYNRKAKEGIDFFYANDKTTGKPSITLFMAYVSFMSALCAGIYSVFFPSTLLGTFALMAFAIVYTILYMIRSLNKAKFDLDDKSFEVSNDEKKEEK